MKKSSKVTAVILSAVLAMSMIGCGSSAEDTASDAAATDAVTDEATDAAASDEATDAADEATDAADETAAGDRTKLIVGFDAESPPYGYMDENGEYVGFDLDLAQEVCDRNGWELVKQPIDWDAKDMELSSIRNQKIGFVFQTYNLIPRTSALKNVERPMLYAKVPGAERTERAKELLKLVGMEDRMKHNPDELSGGQKQRVAIARAMANHPAILLADEPTGALDSKTGRLIMDIFHQLNREQGMTILLITHSDNLAEETGRIFTLMDGEIIGERRGTLADN